jgi:hypothetical protein
MSDEDAVASEGATIFEQEQQVLPWWPSRLLFTPVCSSCHWSKVVATSVRELAEAEVAEHNAAFHRTAAA